MITWGFAGSDDLPPGASVVEVRFVAEGTGTLVGIVHRDLRETEATKHARGWRRFLAELERAVAGRDQATCKRVMTPEDRFNVLAESFAHEPHVTLPGEGRGFGSAALRTHGKIFAMLVRGALVVKLPKQRVDELVGAGEGTPFDANKGKPMKEWLSLDPRSRLGWASLAHEALDYVTPRQQSAGNAASRHRLT